MCKDELVCRLEDLNYRLEELIEADAPYRGWTRLTSEEIRYAIVEYFTNISDVEKAIELVVSELYSVYGIEIPQNDGKYIFEEKQEMDSDQLSLFELTLSSTEAEPLKAA